ncbi:choice-of-anchor D domain-containing protein [Verrucomicrobiota bacterium sgz303538]
MQKLLPILFQLLLLLTVDATSFAADRKDRNKEPSLPKPPPQAVEQSIKVRRGEKLTIPLKIYGSQREALRFLIRKEPANGKLSEPQPRDRESAIVTYEPTNDLSIKQDQFSYAVQSSAGVSAAADVVITIVDDPPVLVFPDTINFAAILAGKSGTQEIEISNTGGGMAEGELKADAPWNIEGSSNYRLGAGEKRTVKLVFAPTAPGPFRGELHFSSDRTRTIALRGEAQAAIAADPSSIELQPQAGETVRSGVIELVNGTSEPQTVTFSENTHLRAPKTVELPANGRVTVTVQTAPGYVAALAEELVGDGAGIQVRIPVKGKAVGPVLRRIGEQIGFGTVTPGSGGAAVVEVQNEGGAEGYWRWESIAPFTPAEQGFKLAAGEKKALTVHLDPAASGQFRAVLKLIGEQQTVEIPAEATVVAQSRAPSVPTHHSVPRSSSSSVRQVSTKPAPRQPSREEREPGTTGTPILPVTIRRVESTRAEVSWPADRVNGNFRVEVRTVGLDRERKLKVTWSEMPSVQLHTENKQVIGEINGLAPGKLYAFRIVNTPAGADTGTPVGMVQLTTPPKEPFFRITTLRVLLLLLAGCLGAIVWHRFRAH